ncbi:LrgA [Rhodanobacter glycinis]|uniref:LrgA n=1 Tax=Rhodanobacter glycinis TaxID=582702 RepID=UPI001125D689|nr:LrgA [Rhodanobacter glycinis]TPG50497.1 LrgA [Rhodanobacter glycinis]
MNSPAPVRGKWDKVEFYTSYFLLLVLISFIGTRLGFATVWQLPTIDFVLSVIAVLLVLASFWSGRQSRRWRLWSIAFATATQIVPMVIREPVLLFPLIGALIPIAILAGCLIALSRKGANIRPPQGS